jgi:hypothetical protein
MGKENMRFINKILGDMASPEDKEALDRELGTRANQIRLAQQYLVQAFPLDAILMKARGLSTAESERNFALAYYTRGILEQGGAQELLKPSVITQLAFNEVLRQRGLNDDNTEGIE